MPRMLALMLLFSLAACAMEYAVAETTPPQLNPKDVCTWIADYFTKPQITQPTEADDLNRHAMNVMQILFDNFTNDELDKVSKDTNSRFLTRRIALARQGYLLSPSIDQELQPSIVKASWVGPFHHTNRLIPAFRAKYANEKYRLWWEHGLLFSSAYSISFFTQGLGEIKSSDSLPLLNHTMNGSHLG